jgi:hypothetical protein
MFVCRALVKLIHLSSPDALSDDCAERVGNERAPLQALPQEHSRFMSSCIAIHTEFYEFCCAREAELG